MLHMLCRNRVADFEKWKQVFDSHAEAQQAAGLNLLYLWRSLDDPRNIFFLFEVESLDKARAFISAPQAAEAGQKSGVIDGDVSFVEAWTS
jgi:hypothetical protein